jgi:23S rRNA pseudouridine1911/1915/1917 synthase
MDDRVPAAPLHSRSAAPLESERETIVDAAHAGVRLDLFLARDVPAPTQGATRSAIQKMIADGCITLNGQRTKPGARLKRGDRVEIHFIPPKQIALAPEPLPLAILYEDADCIVLNKAPGMVVHPAAGWKNGTLVNALLYHCPDLPGIGGERRPGIVHRLDKDTSGVMVVAKNGGAFQDLAAQFKDRRVSKEYLAVVWGRMARQKGAIDRSIGRHRSDRKRMSSVRAGSRARAALTEWRVEEFFPPVEPGRPSSGVTLLRLRPHSGRTHQLRVHLADEGHPVLGDAVYGPKRRGAADDPMLRDFPRQALHAERLEFFHPRSRLKISFYAPLPSDMAELLRGLRERGRTGDRKDSRQRG